MPLFVLSGMPCEEKAALFVRLVSELEKRYPVQVVLQNAVGENTREETSRIKAEVANRTRKDVLVAVCAPLHIKSIRYEIFSAAKNVQMEMCHVYYKGEDRRAKELKKEDFSGETEVTEISVEGKAESSEVLKRIFEVPKKSDTWDFPTASVSSADVTEALLEEVQAALEKQQKKRVSSTKLFPQKVDQGYVGRIKEEIAKVIAEEKEKRYLPLRVAREAELNFLGCIRTNPPDLSHARAIFKKFLEDSIRMQNGGLDKI